MAMFPGIFSKAAYRGRGAPFAAAFALGLLCVMSTSVPAGAAQVYPPLFGTTEVRSTNFKPFKKWNAALKRYAGERTRVVPGSCQETRFNKCHYDRWMAFLKGLRGADRMTQIRLVNAYMNEAPYITDPENWGVRDYWESPGEFMAKFGDCEDYAIIKYMSLKKLGFHIDEMRVVAVRDLNLRIGHAVLAVYLDGKAYILDNQIEQVVRASTIHHYDPVFSINEKHWWRHRHR
jgi:predicted transglutaminase-like cysteine proteinase